MHTQKYCILINLYYAYLNCSRYLFSHKNDTPNNETLRIIEKSIQVLINNLDTVALRSPIVENCQHGRQNLLLKNLWPIY